MMLAKISDASLHYTFFSADGRQPEKRELKEGREPLMVVLNCKADLKK
jgi:hypothetical protein